MRELPYLHQSARSGFSDRAGARAAQVRPTIELMDTLTIAGRTFRSRLFVGTGKYRSFQEMARCHEASGADVVTVAVRRVNLPGSHGDRSQESLLDYIDTSKYFLLPNT